MIIMSVDLGKARTGIAASDNGEGFAFPKKVITEYNTEKLVQKIADTANELSAELIVVGCPKNMDGSVGSRAQECMQIGEQIGNLSGKEIVMWDERCTTLSAHTLLNMNDTRGKRRKQTVDAVAATIILEDYLAFRKNRKED